jgi:hypothetical protein
MTHRLAALDPVASAPRARRRTLLSPLAVMALLALGACASTPPPAAQAAPETAATAGGGAGTAVAKARPQQVCRREAPSGMMIPVTVCRTVESVEARSREEKAWAERLPTQVPEVGR